MGKKNLFFAIAIALMAQTGLVSCSNDDDNEGTIINIQEATPTDITSTLVSSTWSVREDIVEADETDTMTETWTFQQDGTLLRSGVDDGESYTDRSTYSVSKMENAAYVKIGNTTYTVLKFTTNSFEMLYEWSQSRWSGSSRLTGRKG